MALALNDAPARPHRTTTAAGRAAARSRPGRAPGTGHRARRLPRMVHKAVLSTHVLASVGWFGAAVAIALAGLAGRSSGEIALYEFIRSALWLTVPLGLAAAATGAVLSATTRWGFVRYWWVVGKEVITIAAIATDVLVVGPSMTRAIDAGTPGELPGPIFAHCVILALATILSVVKPRARAPLAPERAA